MRIRSPWQKWFGLPSLCAALLAIASSANAVVILSNLGNGDGDGELDLTMNGGSASTRIRGAVGFTIGGTEQSGTFLFTVRLNNPSAEVISLRLVNDSGGVTPTPTGSQIAVANPASSTTISGGGLGYTLSWDGTLAANTRYWVIAAVEGTVGDSATWVDRGAYTANGASFFQAQTEAFGGWTENVGVNLSLGIDVTPVPEPAQTGAIAALFLVACSLAHTFRGRAVSRLRKLFT